MRVGAILFQALFVLHAEMLFFIDDDHADIAELDRFREERVRADDDIDASVLKAFPRFLGVRR